MANLKITNVLQISSVASTDDFYIKTGTDFRRVPVSKLMELIASSTFFVHISWNGSTFVCTETYAEIYAKFGDDNPIGVLLDGTIRGWVANCDANGVTMYVVDTDSGDKILYEFKLSSENVLTSAQQKIGNAMSPTKTAVSGSTPSITAETNTIYTCGEVSSLTVTASANMDFTVIFTSGATAATLTMDQRITMPDGFTVEANTRYEINVSAGYAVVAFWSASS